MDIGEFKSLVAGYMNRDASAFVVTSATGQNTDLLLLAANNAKLYAQRKMLFEWAKGPLLFTAHPTAGVNWGTGRLYGTDIFVGVRHLLRASILNADGTRMPVDMVTIETCVQDAKRQGEYMPKQVMNYSYSSASRPRVVLSGTILYVEGMDTTTNIDVVCDGHYWLVPYQDQPQGNPSSWPGKTDFFITYCTDWMLYRSIQELNLFLKEDQRQPISMRFVDDAWETVRTWNSNLANTTDDLSLD